MGAGEVPVRVSDVLGLQAVEGVCLIRRTIVVVVHKYARVVLNNREKGPVVVVSGCYR